MPQGQSPSDARNRRVPRPSRSHAPNSHAPGTVPGTCLKEPCSRDSPRDVALRAGSDAGGGAGEARLEAKDRLRVELRDAGLGDAEHLADLAQGELLVVVERHD